MGAQGSVRAVEEAVAARAAAEAAAVEGEAALARLRREQEVERERVKRALADLKKKLDRCEGLRRVCLVDQVAGEGKVERERISSVSV